MATSTKDTVDPDERRSEGEALNRLVLAAGGNKKVASKADVAPAYLSQLMQGNRPLNLKAAIGLAAAMGKHIEDFSPRLAELVKEALPHVSTGRKLAEPPAAYHVTRQQPAPAWPFEHVTAAQWEQLTPGGRRRIEQLVEGMVIESEAAKKASPPEKLAS